MLYWENENNCHDLNSNLTLSFWMVNTNGEDGEDYISCFKQKDPQGRDSMSGCV